MKIVIYSHFFYPSVGGLETVSETLANLFVLAGHQCTVVTSTQDKGKKDFPFEVFRYPGIKNKIDLIKWGDIILSNGASMELLWYCKILSKPFVWIHAGYQATCIDGLGWVEGEPAPLDPWKSILFHKKKYGLKPAIIGGLKLYLRRFACKYLVDMNIAITDWVTIRQPFQRQIRIYNPISLTIDPFEFSEPKYDFLYVGRLVSEKGVETLLKAIAIIKDHYHNMYSLLIVGDGNWREKLETVARQLNIENQVNFVGRKTGKELAECVSEAEIAIVPSEWEEPMGIVALELLAAGKNIIVSERGGLAECVGKAGLLFPNGNAEKLAEVMLKLKNDNRLRELQREIAKDQIKKFNKEELVEEYLNLFKKILNKNS